MKYLVRRRTVIVLSDSSILMMVLRDGIVVVVMWEGLDMRHPAIVFVPIVGTR